MGTGLNVEAGGNVECGSRETSLHALAPVQVRYKGSLDKGE